MTALPLAVDASIGVPLRSLTYTVNEPFATSSSSQNGPAKRRSPPCAGRGVWTAAPGSALFAVARVCAQLSAGCAVAIEITQPTVKSSAEPMEAKRAYQRMLFQRA